jgi:hypothetical protein
MLEIMFEDRPRITMQRDHLKPIFVYRNQDQLGSIGVPASGSVTGIEVLRRQLSGLFAEEEEKERVGVDPSKYVEGKIESMLADRKKVRYVLLTGIGQNWQEEERVLICSLISTFNL